MKDWLRLIVIIIVTLLATGAFAYFTLIKHDAVFICGACMVFCVAAGVFIPKEDVPDDMPENKDDTDD